jgi:hypothetical protein
MNQPNFLLNGENRPASLQELAEQQEQINSLAISLENTLNFIQAQEKQGSVSIADLSVATQESIRYLSVVVNNLEFLKEQMDVIRPGFALMKDTIEKSNRSQTDDLRMIGDSLKTFQNEQSKLQSSLTAIRKSPVFQSSSDKLDWRTLSLLGIGIGLTTAFSSAVSVNLVTAKYNENATVMYKKIQQIQEHLGVKEKPASRNRNQ